MEIEIQAVRASRRVVAERADLILELGGYGHSAATLQRLSLVRLRLLALRTSCPGLFLANGAVR